MDPLLAKLVEKDTPKLNPDLANGLATVHMKKVLERVDSQIRNAMKIIPAELGMRYKGFRQLMPHEEFRELTRKHTIGGATRSRYNLARSDLYMVEYTFEYKGVDIKRILSLPFLNNEGCMYISGSKFIISPVLCDKIISIDVNKVFVKLNLAKNTFYSQQQYFVADGKRETVQMVYSALYNYGSKNKGLPKAITALTTMVHYLFAEYGFTKTMHEFAGIHPVVGTTETLTEDRYPSKDWVICESIGLKPNTLSISRNMTYVPTSVKLAVPRHEYENNPNAKRYIVVFFYLLDHWPRRVRPEHVDDLSLWKQFLGELLWGNSVTLGRMESIADEHLESLRNYIDSIMKLRFEEIGMPVDNFFQLMAQIVNHFDEWVLQNTSDIACMYNKELEVLYYVLKNVSDGINNFYFRLTKAYNKKGNTLTVKEVEDIFKATMKAGLIYKLTSDRAHVEISTINTSSDNKAFKTTAAIIPQETTGTNTDNVSPENPSQHLNSSLAEICAYTAINKASPDGHNRINHCAIVDANGKIQRNPKFRELLDDVQQLLKRNH